MEDGDEAFVQQESRRCPRYALRTVSNSAPEFANHEQDLIRQSFSTGNHTWMKETLPVELRPDTINLLRRQRMERSRLAEPMPQPLSKLTQLWGGGYYQEFEYMPDEYERRSLYEVSLRQESVEKREQIANHEWRYVSQERKGKYEPMLTDPRNKETYPYLGGDKDAEWEASKHMFRSSGATSSKCGAWSQDKTPLPSEASFLAGKGRGLEDDGRSSRMTLPTIILRLQRRLDIDWDGSTCVVSTTDQDLVQIAFRMMNVDSERGVVAYMNVLTKDTQLVGSLGLRKVSQLWGMKRDFSSDVDAGDQNASIQQASKASASEHTWMFFLLMPRWVRMRPTDAYYTVHPRSQGSAFRMSSAGSSVLLSLGSSVHEKSEKRKESPPPQQRSVRGARAGGGSQPSTPRLDIGMIEQAVSSLPAIREGRAP